MNDVKNKKETVHLISVLALANDSAEIRALHMSIYTLKRYIHMKHWNTVLSFINIQIYVGKTYGLVY